MLARVESLPLSDHTMQRRILAISEHLQARLKKMLADCLCFSIAVDESTDCRDVSQLCVWIRFVNSSMMAEEELLCFSGMHGRTRGSDILRQIEQTFEKFELDRSKLVSICTDGAPAMTGTKIGLVSLLREKSPHLLGFHCIIHQEALCAKISSPKLLHVMESVISIVNFIRGNALHHREFVEFAELDVLLHAEVRWLSKGKVLNRLIMLLPKIIDFLDSKQISKFDKFLCDVQWIRAVSFLADITTHLNNLNVNLQGMCLLLVETLDNYFFGTVIVLCPFATVEVGTKLSPVHQRAAL